MKRQIKLTESEFKSVIEGAVSKLVKEYTDFDKRKFYGRASSDEDDDFNEQPANNIASEGKQYKVNESQLYSIIKESVMKILKESGDTHRFGAGKYGLAMDAASKARSLGRIRQSDNLKSYAADDFNERYGMNGFEMDEYGTLRHRGEDGKERMYRPSSMIKNLEAQKGLQGGNDKLDNALRNNSYIKNAAQIAKAYPRKKMTSGIDTIEKVDNGIYGNQ